MGSDRTHFYGTFPWLTRHSLALRLLLPLTRRLEPFLVLIRVHVRRLRSPAEGEEQRRRRWTRRSLPPVRCCVMRRRLVLCPHQCIMVLLCVCWPLDSNSMPPHPAYSLTVLSAAGQTSQTDGVAAGAAALFMFSLGMSICIKSTIFVAARGNVQASETFWDQQPHLLHAH